MPVTGPWHHQRASCRHGRNTRPWPYQRAWRCTRPQLQLQLRMGVLRRRHRRCPGAKWRGGKHTRPRSNSSCFAPVEKPVTRPCPVDTDPTQGSYHRLPLPPCRRMPVTGPWPHQQVARACRKRRGTSPWPHQLAYKCLPRPSCRPRLANERQWLRRSARNRG